MTEFIIVLSTVSSVEDARKISGALIQKKLAACVNIVKGMTSVYEWKGEIQNEEECLMIIKSRKALVKEIQDIIVSMHPYDVPEVICIPVAGGLESYLNWIRDNTTV